MKSTAFRWALLASLFVSTTHFAQVKQAWNPAYFKTLVNPECSHCIDESRRRTNELRSDDRVLAWIRGKYDGGAVPLRFFLVPYRVISDTYGVWVFDADAGFVRGYEPSLDFRFYGWRNGVMVIQHKDGTLFSALSGWAFEGPRKGAHLTAISTLQADWGYWLQAYPKTVAYHMFPKYTAEALPESVTAGSAATRPAPDRRLAQEEEIVGIALGKEAKAYPISVLKKTPVVRDRIGDQDYFVLWFAPTRTAAIYAGRLDTPAKSDPSALTLEYNAQIPTAPFLDKETFSHWTIEGRAVEGPLAHRTLVWLPGVQCKWFAWAAEYPQTGIYSSSEKQVAITHRASVARLIQGQRLDWDKLMKMTGTFTGYNSAKNSISIAVDSDPKIRELLLSSDSEILREGRWGSVTEFRPNERIFLIAQPEADGQASTLHALADEVSFESLSRPYVIQQVDMARRRLTLVDPKGRRAALDLQVDAEARLHAATGQWPGINAKIYGQFREDHGQRSLSELWDEPSLATARQRHDREQLSELQRSGLSGTILEADRTRQQLTALVVRADAWWARTVRIHQPIAIKMPSGQLEFESTVLEVRPDYSRVRFVLQLGGTPSNLIRPGESIRLVTRLPDTIPGDQPPDLGRFAQRQDRIDYFLSTIYCPCGMIGTSCAGHWNTLAACKIHGCGLPDLVTTFLNQCMDAGKTDPEILSALRQKFSDDILHLHQN